jgi:hypothetical protein
MGAFLGREAAAQAVAVEQPVEAAAPSLRGAERAVGRVLRGGALLSGALFLASLGLELLPATPRVGIAIDTLQKAGASLLLVTPVVRLFVAGAVMGMRGEWKYALCAVYVLGLLALAVGAHVAV